MAVSEIFMKSCHPRSLCAFLPGFFAAGIAAQGKNRFFHARKSCKDRAMRKILAGHAANSAQLATCG
jgi:hypothetical protein